MVHNSKSWLVILLLMLSGLLPSIGNTANDKVKALSISGTKFEDYNGDGFLSAGEAGVPGWTIRLLNNGTWTLATTDIQGHYTFRNLRPGKYTVLEDHQSGWRQTTPGCQAYHVTLTDKDASRLDFGDIKEIKADNISSSSLVYQLSDYTFTHPTPSQLLRWEKIIRKMPKTPLVFQPELTLGQDKAPGSRFSLLDKIQYCPAERNQGKCGNCWVWAGMGVLETDLAAKRGIKDRLSIQYINSLSWGCDGGTLSNFTGILNASKKVIPWSNANAQWSDGGIWHNDSFVPLSSISTSYLYEIAYIVPQEVPTRDVGREQAISNIKNVLHQGKAVFFGFYLPTKDDVIAFKNFWKNQSESEVFNLDLAGGKSWNDDEGVGHGVVCVGYDDTDPDNQYWIMLNSWGDRPKRQNGLFRVNMDMNYDCSYRYQLDSIPAFFWVTFDVHYPDARLSLNIQPLNGYPGHELLYSPLDSTNFSNRDSSQYQDQSDNCSSQPKLIWKPLTT